MSRVALRRAQGDAISSAAVRRRQPELVEGGDWKQKRRLEAGGPKGAKVKARTLGVRAFRMTVAGGFGGSGDDQSSLGGRGERDRGEEGGGGDEAEKLGHVKLPKLVWRVCAGV